MIVHKDARVGALLLVLSDWPVIANVDGVAAQVHRLAGSLDPLVAREEYFHRFFELVVVRRDYESLVLGGFDLDCLDVSLSDITNIYKSKVLLRDVWRLACMHTLQYGSFRYMAMDDCRSKYRGGMDSYDFCNDSFGLFLLKFHHGLTSLEICRTNIEFLQAQANSLVS